jgi:peroxin-19
MADVPVKKEEQEPVKVAAATAPPPEVASDPEEDDLSDLDDVLDEFANTKIDSKAPAAPTAKAQDAPISAPSASGPGRPEDMSPGALLVEDEDAFAKQLQKEMEQLLGQGDFGKQFEDIMKEMSLETGANPLAADPPSSSSKEGKGNAESSESAAKAEKNFQETIKKTMERMQNSGDAAGAAAASSSQDDMLAQMLASMGEGGFGGGDGDDEDFSKILMGMMEQLTNREILYEPMKELNDKFPKWMEANSTKVEADDLKRYQEQQVLVKEITERFERKGYSDNNAGDREYIVERMQKVCIALISDADAMLQTANMM